MRIWYRRLGWLIAIYALQRLLFLYFNFHALKLVPLQLLLWAFIDGLRFDLCAIATINTPILALQYISIQILNLKPFEAYRGVSYYTNRLAGLLFLAANIPFIGLGFVDSQLFTFTGRRITPDLFALTNDIQEQSLSLVLQYWQITLIGVTATGLMAWKTFQTEQRNASPRPALQQAPRVFVVTLIAILLIRGGWQTKPLSPAHAYGYHPSALANLVLNSSITFMRTPSEKTTQPYSDFLTMSDVRSALSFTPTDSGIAKGKNFVILIVESLATEYVGGLNGGSGYTPFVDSLIKKSIVFEKSFANGRRSIDAMPAIFASLPAWRDQPFITSPYATNSIRPLPMELKKYGYSSAFFHGASNGTMHFDVFAQIAGFDHYFGRKDYPERKDDDGQWGIFDEPFLKFAGAKFSQLTEPFLIGIFTLSSHNPYKIPTELTGKFPKGTLPIHESIGYADYSLGEFFKFAELQSWYKNTIFVITGDHTSLSDHAAYNNFSGRFRVPILFFDPLGKLPMDVQGKIASHIDIPATIFHLIGAKFDTPWLLGGPLFDQKWTGHFTQYENDTWLYLDRDRQVYMRDSSNPALFPGDDFDLKIKSNITPADVDRLKILKAERQYFVNGMLENSWLSH